MFFSYSNNAITVAAMPKVCTNLRNTESLLRRPKNSSVRSREYLRPNEVEKLIDAAKSVGRHKVRDSVLILMMFRHGLRVNEAVDLRWTDIDWQTAHIHIKRLKRGSSSVQPIASLWLCLPVFL